MRKPYETQQSRAFDESMFRQACGRFASGVTIVSAGPLERPHGMTVSAFMSVSLHPPLIAVSLAGGSRTLNRVRETQSYAVSVLSHRAESVAQHFSGNSKAGPLPDMWQDFDCLPVISEACAVLSADLEQAIEAGDHYILTGRVRALNLGSDHGPLLHHAGGFTQLRES